MDPVVVWLGWLALFLIYELYAAISKPKGDSLSERIWDWFGVRAARRFTPLRRLCLAAFMLALTAHFVFGWSVVPVIVTGVLVGLVIVYATFFERLPLGVLALLALPLLGAKACNLSCADLTKALEAAKASGDPGAIAAAGWALAEAGCPIVVEHEPTCPLPGQSADPSKWCGCWETSGRTGGEWHYIEDCPPATCPDGLPPGSDGCPKTCADLACPNGCTEGNTGATCNPAPADCRTDGCPAGQHCLVESVHGNRSGPPETWTEGTMASCVCDWLGVPWCHEAVPPMTCGQCKHQPAGKRCPILAPECPAPPPMCPATCPAGTACTDPLSGCVATPPPPSGGCSIDGEPGALIPGRRPELGAVVNETIHALRPDCDPGSRCVLAEGRQAWQARVVAELRRRGLCAGQHAPETDEIAAAASATAPREGWHVYAGPWSGPGTVVWSPQAARPAYAAPVSPPPPTSPPGDCPPAMVGAIEDQAARQMVAKPAACRNCYDATPRVCGHPAAAILAERPGQRCVPLGPDKSEMRVACEALFLGGPTPEWRGEGVSLDPDPPLAWQVRAFGSGRLRACDRRGVTCSPWLIQ